MSNQCKSPTHRRSLWLAAGLAAFLTACGGGGSEEPTASADGPGEPAALAGGNTVVLASFAGGTAGLVVYDEGAANTGQGTLAASSAASDGDGAAVQVTLAAPRVLLQLPSPAVTDWSNYRTLLVDVTSTNAIDATEAKLVTKSGASFAWCQVQPQQAAPAGAMLTYAFRLDWNAMQCFGTAAPGDVREVYLQLGGGTGNTVVVDNVRLTKSVRVMALGDSITQAPRWRQLLAEDLSSNGYTQVDMVGLLNDGATEWDSDHEGHGCILARDLAAAARTSRMERGGCPTHVGNLEVWLESSRPDLVMLNLGTNDVWSGVSPTVITSAFDTLVSQMRASNPKMHILAAKILPMNPAGCGDCTARVAALNAAIEGWAACARTATSPVAVVDLTLGWDAATMTADGVHPNEAGAIKLEANWSTAVKSAIDGIDSLGSDPDPSCAPLVELDDAADGTMSADGSAVLLTSFRTVGRLDTFDTGGIASASAAAVTRETGTVFATEGTASAKVVVGTADAMVGIESPAFADWSGYRYLKVDMAASGGVWWTQVVTKSGNTWAWCTLGQSGPSHNGAAAISAPATVTFDLQAQTCYGATGTSADYVAGDVRAYYLLVQAASGTYHIDNMRLSKTAD